MELQGALGGLTHIFVQALLVRAAPLSQLNSEAEPPLHKNNKPKQLFNHRVLQQIPQTHSKNPILFKSEHVKAGNNAPV